MDGNGKNIYISDLEKKFFWSSSKIGESVGNAKQTIFYFWPGCGGYLGHVTQMPRTNFRPPYT